MIQSLPRKTVRFIPAIFLMGLLCMLPSVSRAQGMLPKSSTGTLTGENIPLLISDPIPPELTVIDSSGTERPILSFKSPIDVLVIAFLSPACSVDQARGHDLRNFYEKYRNWHVTFLAVNEGPAGTDGVTSYLSKNRIPIEVVTDPQQHTAKWLHPTGTPEIMIFDEVGLLKYRGPLLGSGKHPARLASVAIDAVIGHVDEVPYPEPTEPIGCALP